MNIPRLQKGGGHRSVLTKEVIEYLNLRPGKVYVDVTFGAGGHTRAILDADSTCTVIALDWDKESIKTYEPALQEQYGDRVKVLWGSFAHLYRILKKHKIGKVDGILADFGTSHMQLTERAGFSFLHDTELDMRMSAAHYPITAAHVINHSTEEKLREIFYQLGEEKYARSIVRAIIERRQKKKFKTTVDLAEVVASAVPKKRGPRRIHPATRVFQALRMYVNHELDNLRSFLSASVQVLHPKGRVVCISFHSLEDRFVKQFFREQEEMGCAQVITKKVISASEEEIEKNPSSRSAKLRALEWR